MSNARVVHGPGFSIRYDDEAGYLRAYVSDGTDSLEVSVAMWRMLAAEAAAVDAARMLVLEDLQGTVPMGEIGQVIDVVLEVAPRDLRVAFVELRDDMEGNELGMILCRENGLDCRVFSNETEARNWLLYGD